VKLETNATSYQKKKHTSQTAGGISRHGRRTVHVPEKPERNFGTQKKKREEFVSPGIKKKTRKRGRIGGGKKTGEQKKTLWEEKKTENKGKKVLSPERGNPRCG